MTLAQDGNRFRLVCRDCRIATASYAKKQFRRMIDDARDAGWKIEKRGEDYSHTCPSCAEAQAQANDRRLL